jgi:hypothetical protein
MGKKLMYEDVKQYIDNDLDNESILLTTKEEYVNTITNMKFLCKCGNEFETTFTYFKSENKKQCNSCGAKKRNKDTRLTYDYIKSYIEGEEGNGCKLLSKCYENNMTLLKIQCSCGNEFTTNFREFKQGNKKQCNDCGHINKITAKSFSYDEVKNYIEIESNSGYKLLSDTYINTRSPLKMTCDKGHINEQRFDDFKQGHRCNLCRIENSRSELLPLKIYLRNTLSNWRNASIDSCNNKCVVTGLDFDDVHHLYSFGKIVEEIIEELKYPIYKEVKKYNYDELTLLKDKCLEKHYKYGLGVCVTKEIHTLFHSTYGLYNNTKEQFLDFTYKYKNGEFNITS